MIEVSGWIQWFSLRHKAMRTTSALGKISHFGRDVVFLGYWLRLSEDTGASLTLTHTSG